jgi:hypothetical protein
MFDLAQRAQLERTAHQTSKYVVASKRHKDEEVSNIVVLADALILSAAVGAA